MSTQKFSTPRQENSPDPIAVSEREIAVQRYVNALEKGDESALERVLLLAQNDAMLAAQLDEIDLALARELPPFALGVAPGVAAKSNGKSRVRALLNQHFPEAHIPTTSRPLTVGEVILRLEEDGPILPADRAAAQQLQGDTTPLPAWLSAGAIAQLAQQLNQKLGISASERFWRRFKDAAIFAGMRHTPPQAQLGLAREEWKRRRSEPNEESNENEEVTSQ